MCRSKWVTRPASAEQSSVDEWIDGHDPAATGPDGVRQHDGGTPLVAADLQRHGAGRQRAGLLEEQLGLLARQPSRNAVGERPDFGEADHPADGSEDSGT